MGMLGAAPGPVRQRSGHGRSWNWLKWVKKGNEFPPSCPTSRIQRRIRTGGSGSVTIPCQGTPGPAPFPRKTPISGKGARRSGESRRKPEDEEAPAQGREISASATPRPLPVSPVTNPARGAARKSTEKPKNPGKTAAAPPGRAPPGNSRDVAQEPGRERAQLGHGAGVRSGSRDAP